MVAYRMLDFLTLTQHCAPQVASSTMAALVSVESQFNPYAIGVVGGRLTRQPKNREEAIATAQNLEANGFNFSVGIAQVNRHNLATHHLTYAKAFDPCANITAGAAILQDCFQRASTHTSNQQQALKAAFSCYYSGNFTRGFKPDKVGQPSYVDKIWAQAEPSMAIIGNPSSTNEPNRSLYSDTKPVRLTTMTPPTMVNNQPDYSQETINTSLIVFYH